ncbi:MAG: phytoene/squalene synthase family protein [Burkholderiaceae bacterium]|jgi:phytoene synthase|nr:phytoene/squalene synthase family protein [Burkholderiales bacterium]MCZ8108182.1 phytoene/squalene synthase family protein [Burkholderiales bacterium]MCZ8337649.1 phytoene/squalene synthase family protein [Burkholderiaceae bacterium]
MPPTATLSFDLEAAPAFDDAPARAVPDAAADLAACRAQLADGSRTFLAASRLLPRAVRDPACALYAFCRTADDAVDLDTVDELAAVARLRTRLARIYAGQPEPTPADRAFARVVVCHAMPRELPEALLDGFEWDARGRRYETIEDLHDYAARVAGTVGAMMAVLMRRRSPEALARACDLGVAMQLSNIARDVGEDARRGRVYLPLAWLREAGVDPDAWLAEPVFDRRIAAVVRRLLRHADTLYARVEAGIALLPPACRPGIQAARVLYAEIGREVERRGCDSVSQRAVVSGRRKLALLARALAEGVVARPGAGAGLPPLDAVGYLVDAVVRTDAPPPAPALRVVPDAAARPGTPSFAFAKRAVWVIELCEQQAQRRLGRHDVSQPS